MNVALGYFLFLIILELGISTADESKNLPRFVPSSNRTPDLDFTEDVQGMPPLFTESELVYRNYHWLYWSLGITAAAGGVTFLLWDKAPPQKIQKSVQEFSDDED